ncbi:bifunctional riboflavin kinase/FAD synthetase [Endomicrobium proavitum]|uniref:Riboflavin biosynthesis protein n=1 Tax=Endomicrobium proavitum TaxID=1408281 RepID=A0A0G3WKZ0_9BACT|nr:bifunctional riboflavin kinase/FAD synthetase [Endomicrobium proavitum]AKL98169.1 Riboflavin biosynthesis protein RibF [Endomicrobium proavitum]
MKTKNSAVTIGTFDGVHKGHKLLIEKTLLAAKKNNYKSVVVALEKPVRRVSGVLSLGKEKIAELSKFPVDEIVVLKVPSEILLSEPEDFFNNFLIKFLNAKIILCGQDFAFGKNRKGSAAWLKKQPNIKLEIINPLKISGKQISSSKIRALLERGDITGANKMLGRNYYFSGMPFKDRGLGAKLGFPTVNLKIDADKLLPKGVFVSLIEQNGKFFAAVTNIGLRPTFGKTDALICETHILNFSGIWKKSKTTVYLLKKLRSEKKFKNIAELKAQIAEDTLKAKKYFQIA